jgi:hypothetical protein
MRTMALAACLATTGCSFAFVSGPPANHQQLPYFDCTSGRAAPILDVVWTAFQLLNLATLASTSEAEFDAQFEATPGGNDPPFSRTTGMTINAVLGAAGAFGAYYGFKKTGECRAAKSELVLRMNTTGQGFGPQTPGTWPPPAAPAPAPYAPAPEPAPAPPPPQ